MTASRQVAHPTPSRLTVVPPLAWPPRLRASDRRLDHAYRRWVATTLPSELRPLARELPRVLGHARQQRWESWRTLYGTPVFSSLPYLVWEGFPAVSHLQLHALGMAHVFLVFLALLDDRYHDAQIVFSREVNLLRRAMEAEAQAWFAAGGGAHLAFWREYRRAFREYTTAHALEPTLWAGKLTAYTHVCDARDAAAKAALGRIAGLGVAIVGGATPAIVRRIARAVDHYMIGMQALDDVMDWEEDFRGGRWSHFVLRHLDAREARRQTTVSVAALRARVMTAGLAEEFLERSHRHFSTCQTLLADLGMPSFRAWVEARRRQVRATAAMFGQIRDQHRDRFSRGLRACLSA